MPVEVQFQPGSRPMLVALLNSIKDFLPTNAANLIFTPRGLALRFASGRNTDSRVVVACHIDAEPNHRPFGFAKNTTPPAGFNAGRRRSSVSSTGTRGDAEDSRSDAGDTNTPFTNPPPGLGNATIGASAGSGYGVVSKYVCHREAVFVGFNPRLMIDQMKLVDDDDKITIRAEEGDDGTVAIYEMYIESQDFTRKCLYEVDAIPLIDRFVPLPDIPYHVVVQIQAGEFQRIVSGLHDTSDKIAITANKNSITFLASGSDGTLQVGLVQKPNSSNESNPRLKVLAFYAPVKHLVDARLMRGFAQASPLSTHVTLHLPPTAGPGRPPAPLRVTFEMAIAELPSGAVMLATEYLAKNPPQPARQASSTTPSAANTPPPSVNGAPASGWRAASNGTPTASPGANGIASPQAHGWRTAVRGESRSSTPTATASPVDSPSQAQPKSPTPTPTEPGSAATPTSATATTPTTTPGKATVLTANVSQQQQPQQPPQQLQPQPPPSTGQPIQQQFIGISGRRNSGIGVIPPSVGMGMGNFAAAAAAAHTQSQQAQVQLQPVVPEEPPVQFRIVGQLHYLLAPEVGPV